MKGLLARYEINTHHVLLEINKKPLTYKKIIIKMIAKNNYACFNCVNANIDCEKIKLQVKPKFVKRMGRSLIKQEIFLLSFVICMI